MEPSLYTLFRRGKYSHHGSIEPDEKEQQQRERFGVSVVAFCLKQELAFRTHFLKSICGRKSAADAIRIRIEPEEWGDLILESKDKTFVYVIECKIAAKLAEHQNPNSKKYLRPPNGYGYQILKHYQRERKKIHYVVLQNNRLPIKHEKVKNIIIHSAEWRQLIRQNGRDEKPLEKDLYNCLGRLGVTSLQSRYLSRMKNLGNAAKGGRDAGLLLKEVIETISGRAPKPDFGKDDNWWWFGLKIPKDVCPKWQPLIKPRRKKSDLGWFGYEGEGDLINLSVWFYCGNQAISVKLLKRLKHKLARQSQRKIAIERQQDEKFPNYVRVSLPAKNSQGDKGWFMEVFEVLDDVRK